MADLSYRASLVIYSLVVSLAVVTAPQFAHAQQPQLGSIKQDKVCICLLLVQPRQS